MPTYNLGPPPPSGDAGVDRWLTALYYRINGTTAQGGMGYANGQGGTVTQTGAATSAVTLNKLSGQITMVSWLFNAGDRVSFVVHNSTVAATDVPKVVVASASAVNVFSAMVSAVAAGQFTVTVKNETAVGFTDSPVISFVVVKAATS